VEALPKDSRIRVRHIGAALDPELGRAARALARRDDRYRYLGPLPHGLARAAIASSDLLIHPSRMEGGANVIVEAVTADTPVVASRVSGNVGMLGGEYPGYFAAGDPAALAEILQHCLAGRGLMPRLRAATRSRRPLFRPEAEARALRALLAKLFM
jgi:glycosyltransferase involved in cell wall biosynthesis